MGGTSTNKPLVFVFGGNDPDSRKRNLSAINTAVAHRAHEQRRAKKSKQRLNARKESAKASNEGLVTSESDQIEEVKDQASAQVLEFTEGTTLQQPLTTSDAPRNTSILQQTCLTLSRVESRSDGCSSDTETNTTTESWSPSQICKSTTPVTDLSANSPLFIYDQVLHTSLDPFYRLPMATSERDRWLLQHYFTNISALSFGTHSNALFCPGRDWVSSYVSSLPLCLQWIVIHAEEHLQATGAGAEPAALIERKNRAYRDLNDVLNDPDMDFDKVVSGIMFAAIMDGGRIKLHLEALDRLIRERGGMQGFLKRPIGIAHPEHLMTVYAFAEFTIPDLKEVEAVKFRFFEMLRLFQKRSVSIRGELRRMRNRRPWDNLSRQVLDDNGVLVPSDTVEHLRYFLKAQEDCFASDSFRSLVFVPYDTTGQMYAEKARHFAMLYQLSTILLELGEGHLAQATFLKRLQYVVEMSSARAHDGQATLNSGAMLLVASFVRQETQAYFDKDQVFSKGISVSEAVIDGLKMFSMLQESGRARVISWLRTWLSLDDRVEDGSDAELSDDDFAGLSSEIIESWYANSLHSS